MPATEAPSRGFALSDFENIPNPPPDDVPKDGSAPAASTAAPEQKEAPAADTTPEKPETQEKEPAAPERPEDEATDKSTSLDDAMSKGPARATKADTKKEVDEAAAAAEKAKTEPEKTPAEQRDADLETERGAHVHPNTKKKFDVVVGKAKAARDERDAVIAEREALKRERDELAAKVKAVPLPKETEEELKTLRERVRELDITKDPAIQSKYDGRMKANDDLIVSILKNQGFGSSKDEAGKMVDNPKAVADLIKNGLTFENLNPLVAKLKEAGLHSEARQIMRAIEKNEDIAEEKQREIDSWKGSYQQRVQQREEQTKQAQEQRSQTFRAQTETELKKDLGELAKNFPYINQPPAPLSTDSPATVQAKNAAIAEFNAAAKQIENAVKSFQTDGVPPDKLHEVVGRLNAAAISSVVLKTQVIPRMLREAAANSTRIKELETKLNKYESAGKLSRLQGSTPSDGATRSGPQPNTLEDALMSLRSDT